MYCSAKHENCRFASLRTGMGTLCAKSRDGSLSNRNLFSHKQLLDVRHDGHELRCYGTCLISGGIQPLWGTLIVLIKKCGALQSGLALLCLDFPCHSGKQTNYYKAETERLEAEAKDHDEMAEAYKKNRSPIAFFGWLAVLRVAGTKKLQLSEQTSSGYAVPVSAFVANSIGCGHRAPFGSCQEGSIKLASLEFAAFTFCCYRHKVSVMPVVVGMPSSIIPGPVIPTDVIARSMTAWIYIERIWVGWVRVKPRARGMQAAGRCVPKPTMPPGGRPIAPVSASIWETVLLQTPVTDGGTMEACRSLTQVSETARRRAVHLCVSLDPCKN